MQPASMLDWALARPGRRSQPWETALRSDLGGRAADRLVGFLGSWRFLVLQASLVACWIYLNMSGLLRIDPLPFILLNLAFSTQASFTGPLVLMAANRAANRDRGLLLRAAEEADIAEDENRALLIQSAEILRRLERIEARLETRTRRTSRKRR